MAVILLGMIFCYLLCFFAIFFGSSIFFGKSRINFFVRGIIMAFFPRITRKFMMETVRHVGLMGLLMWQLPWALEEPEKMPERMLALLGGLAAVFDLTELFAEYKMCQSQKIEESYDPLAGDESSNTQPLKVTLLNLVVMEVVVLAGSYGLDKTQVLEEVPGLSHDLIPQTGVKICVLLMVWIALQAVHDGVRYCISQSHAELKGGEAMRPQAGDNTNNGDTSGDPEAQRPKQNNPRCRFYQGRDPSLGDRWGSLVVACLQQSLFLGPLAVIHNILAIENDVIALQLACLPVTVLFPFIPWDQIQEKLSKCIDKPGGVSSEGQEFVGASV